MAWLFQFLCGLRRQHLFVRRFDALERRLFESCMFCGLERRGWKLTGRPRRRFAGDPKRHQLRRSPWLRRSA